jgi:hypothetical protein
VIDVRIEGGAALKQVISDLRKASEKGLGKEFGKALNKATDPLKKSIEASAEKTMPSGFAPTLTRSLKHRRNTRTDARQASVVLATYATGKKERRDLPAMEGGNLKHPVFGRTRATRRGIASNPWVDQRIKPGFHKRGTEQAGPEAEKQILVVVDEFVERLAEG